MRWGVGGLAIIVTVAALTDASGQQNPSARSFALQLAREHVPVGVVASEQAWRTADQDTTVQVRPDGLLTALSQFNAAGTAFRAERGQNVVRIRPNEEPAFVRAAMARTVYTVREEQVPVQRAVIIRAVGALTGREPEAFVGSGIVPGPECQLNRPVSIPAGPMSFTALLDSIVEQAPGLAWVVLYDAAVPANELKVGFLCWTGVYRVITVNP